MKDYMRKGIYRSRQGAIFGVCRGVAEHFDFSVFWVRFIAVLMLLVSGLWPAIILYLLAALVMKPQPVMPLSSADEQRFYDHYTSSRHEAAQQLRRRYDGLEKRIRRMEDVVTSHEYDWDRRLRTTK
jgi:phage shock protein C